MNLLVLPDDTVSEVDDAEVDDALRKHEAVGQIVQMNIDDDYGNTFGVWMGIDTAQQVNRMAREYVNQLSAIHVLCFGPVLLVGLDRDTAKELIGE